MVFDRKEYNRQYAIDHRDELKQYHIDHRDERNERSRQYYYKNGGQPMAENRSCSHFLGVHIAEQVLSQMFKGVYRMPHNNSGFDFRCGKDYLVDCKSGCSRVSLAGTDYWQFTIRHNPIADYFLCLAFDNRESLNPEHVWLIPGKVLSHLANATISETTLDKWAEYEKPLDKVMACCDTMRGDYHASG